MFAASFDICLVLKKRVMIYPIGIQNFEKIRKEGYLYIDKTAHIHQLATTGSYYFLSRPRRFGKSLLISTMEAYFSGKKELFAGLAMENLEKDWIEYPILHLDLNSEKYTTAESLNRVLNDTLERWEELYGTRPAETSFARRFLGLVERAYLKTGQRVVILVDEYDKPMLQAIGNDELQNEFRSTLKAFYSVLKTQDRYIKFAFLTGVTKFGKVSVFSDLNNLEDISMLPNYADICGISGKEIHAYFEQPLHELAEANGMSYEETCANLKELYDGYHFERDTEGIYNPFSLLNTLKNKKFGDYWFETGTPSFLVELLKTTDYNLNRLLEDELTADVLNSIDSMSKNPVPVIYQSGYLTIKGYNKEFEMYRLGFPNREVENGFIKYLMPYYTPADASNSVFVVSKFVTDVQRGNPEGFMERMQTLFEDNDYRIAGKKEIYFQNAMYVIFKMMGFYTEVERATAKGRVDVVVKTKDFIYIIELKLDGSAEEALEQINAKGYALPYAQDSRKLFKIGVNFSSETRSIEEFVIE